MVSEICQVYRGLQMITTRLASAWLLGGFCFASAVVSVQQSRSVREGHKGWSTYRNLHYNFSFSYPADQWSLREGLDGNGVDLTPKDKSTFHGSPEIGAGGSAGQPSARDESRLQTLDESFQEYLDSMRAYHGQNVVVVERHATKLSGLPAMISTVRFRNSPHGGAGLARDIFAHTQDDSFQYHFGVSCSLEDCQRILPLFGKILKTFRVLGPPA